MSAASAEASPPAAPTWGMAWRVARREMRGGLSGFGVFIACLALGVAAIAAVGVVNAGVLDALARDSRALLGGDVAFESATTPPSPAELRDLVPPGGRVSRTVRTTTLAYGPAGRRAPVSLKAVDDAYPLYGAVGLEPASPLDRVLDEGGIAVDAALLPRLGVELGDRLRLGTGTFTLRAVLTREPDRLGGFFALGPTVLMRLADLRAAGLDARGSLLRHSLRLALPPGTDVAAYLARVNAGAGDAAWRARGFEDARPQIARFTDRLATYLTLAGLTALLVGGLGVALATQNYLAAKTATIATLKCLGASRAVVFRAYLIQILLIAGIGTGLGLVAGQLLPLLVRLVPESLLPIRIAFGFYPLPLALAAGFGLLTALLFSLWPLARAGAVSAAGLFRDLVDPAAAGPGRATFVALGLAAAGLAALAVVGVPRWQLGLGFVATAAVAALVLYGTSRLLLRGVARLAGLAPARYRLALANLHRPGSGSLGVVTALGAGLAVLTAVALIQHQLAREIAVNLPERAPSVFVIDIPPERAAAVRAAVAATPGAEMVQEAPLLRARITRIKGVPVDQAPVDPEVAWTVRRDRGLSYAARPPAGTELTEGTWWPSDYRGPPLVSVDEEVARGYGVGIGDVLGFNVLGRSVEARVGNLRRARYDEGRLDFVFLFSPGLLEAAPHTVVAAIDVPAALEPALLDRLARDVPGATPISVRDLAASAAQALNRIGFAVDAVGGVTLLSGVLVLAGAVAAARRRHTYAAVVLKVLGARRSDLLRVFLVEYVGLGVAAALIGAFVGSLGAFVVAVGVMDLPWSFAPGVIAWVAVPGVGLVLLAGFAGTWRALGRPAGRELRAA